MTRYFFNQLAEIEAFEGGDTIVSMQSGGPLTTTDQRYGCGIDCQPPPSASQVAAVAKFVNGHTPDRVCSLKAVGHPLIDSIEAVRTDITR